MAGFRGKVLLIVNVASKCGFTPQYRELQELQTRYANEGLLVLGFPCNQFGHQEPGSDTDIKSFCDLQYNVTFPLFSKIDVNGSNTHPLYRFLKDERPGILGTKRVKWNFTKFLIDRRGNPIKRYAPQIKPMDIEKDIKEALAGSQGDA